MTEADEWKSLTMLLNATQRGNEALYSQQEVKDLVASLQDREKSWESLPWLEKIRTLAELAKNKGSETPSR